MPSNYSERMGREAFWLNGLYVRAKYNNVPSVLILDNLKRLIEENQVVAFEETALAAGVPYDSALDATEISIRPFLAEEIFLGLRQDLNARKVMIIVSSQETMPGNYMQTRYLFRIYVCGESGYDNSDSYVLSAIYCDAIKNIIITAPPEELVWREQGGSESDSDYVEYLATAPRISVDVSQVSLSPAQMAQLGVQVALEITIVADCAVNYKL